ncbi:hypothetical protein Q7C36_007199 [Tachysurus vachellii]|uniref:Uncharacterized protein n=1 Tax=Tachysurus vachellii TaxID=175792 RepID=A0AA88NE56_TACVA|nr:hypothetical protein Q7C36_007199 [Tachysurus vachellii]
MFQQNSHCPCRQDLGASGTENGRKEQPLVKVLRDWCSVEPCGAGSSEVTARSRLLTCLPHTSPPSCPSISLARKSKQHYAAIDELNTNEVRQAGRDSNLSFETGARSDRGTD